MNQETKKVLKEAVDANIKNAGFKGRVKYSFSVRNHSTIVCTIKSCDIDLIANNAVQAKERAERMGQTPYITEDTTYVDTNPHHYQNSFTGEALEIMDAIYKGLQKENYDNSDIQTDYFDVGYYVNVQIGRWNKPFEVTA